MGELLIFQVFHRDFRFPIPGAKDNFLHLDAALSRHTGVWIPPGSNAVAMRPKKRCRAVDGVGKPGDTVVVL